MPSRTRIEEQIFDIAARQHGLVTSRQLLEIGMTRRSVNARVTAGRLRPVHRGVYLVGPDVSRRTREMAAVLAGGPHTFLSHRTAAALWKLLPRQPASAPVDITVRGRNSCRRPGIRPHRVPRLELDEVSELEGMPVVTPARALLELAGQLGIRELEQAFARAERRDLATRSELSSLIDRYPRRHGAGVLRDMIGEAAGAQMTRSLAEERLLFLVRKGGLPAPELNTEIGGYEVDACWCDQRVVVEVDGFAFHSSRSAFERDRRRDSELSARGFQVLRVTWRQMSDEPEAVLVRLAQTLALAGVR